ncbi:MAG: DUF1559 domain-containing protein [Candidatus Calescibacterium sp.]|nr:DUF1559 domain-containing protein [Candidatus Calescibacterium sp.]
MRAREASRLTACKSNLKHMSTAIETYSNDYNGLYPDNDTDQTNGGSLDNLGSNTGHALMTDYIQKRMPCPTSRSVDYRYRMAQGLRYWVYCPAAGSPGADKEPRHRQGTTQGGPVLDSVNGILDQLQ